MKLSNTNFKGGLLAKQKVASTLRENIYFFGLVFCVHDDFMQQLHTMQLDSLGNLRFRHPLPSTALIGNITIPNVDFWFGCLNLIKTGKNKMCTEQGTYKIHSSRVQNA